MSQNRAYKIQVLEHQEDPLCHGDPECAPSWTSNEVFGNVFLLQHIHTYMLCAYKFTTESDTCKSMVASSTPIETVKHIKLNFYFSASQISTPFKKFFSLWMRTTLPEPLTALLLVPPFEFLALLSTLCLMIMENHKPWWWKHIGSLNRNIDYYHLRILTLRRGIPCNSKLTLDLRERTDFPSWWSIPRLRGIAGSRLSRLPGWNTTAVIISQFT